MPQHPAPPPAPKAQEQYLVYWTTESGWSTELLLRNNLESSQLTVSPALRTPDGTETPLPSQTIAPGDVLSVNLYETLLKAAPQLIGAWGSLVLRYTSVTNGALYASAMVRADGRPIAFHLDAFGRGSKYEVGSREGVWWLPWASVTDYLILTNSGSQPLETSLVLYDAAGKPWQQKLILSSREARRLSIRTLAQQAGFSSIFGGIQLVMGKGARYLDSAHLLFDESGGFSAVMKMFQHDPSTTFSSRNFSGAKEWITRAPMLALSSPDPALALPAGTTLQPKVFIRNASGKAITAHLWFIWRSATTSGKTAPLDLPLKANETQAVDVAALQAQKLLSSDAYWASVILSAPVLPDDLLAVAASYDQTGRYGAQTPFSDQLAPHWEGGKWEVDGTHNSFVAIINGGSKPALAQLTILYNQGKGQYQIEQPLAPDEQLALDFGKLIHDQVPGKNGQTLPPDLTSGAYRIRDLADETVANLYEGKVIVDKTFGHAAYGCMICCGPQSPIMAYDPILLVPSGFGDQGIQALNSCSQKLSTITGDFPTWWTDNTSIATASTNRINGVAIGSTNHNALSNNMYWGPKEDSGGGTCPLSQEQGTAGTDVGPASFDVTVTSTPVAGETNSVVSGQSAQIKVTALLQNGATMSNYTGTIHFSSTDLLAILPPNYAFTQADAGSHTFSVTLKTVSGQSATRDLKVQDDAASIASTLFSYVWFQVVATREGLVGQQTSCGHVITQSDHFVALPATGLCNAGVRLRNGANVATTIVLDVGPWCPNTPVLGGFNQCNCPSDYYWQTSGVPFAAAASCASTHAGIDLADGTFSDLGLTDNGLIYWRFQ